MSKFREILKKMTDQQLFDELDDLAATMQAGGHWDEETHKAVNDEIRSRYQPPTKRQTKQEFGMTWD